jgi:hypothetical protein
MKAWRNLLRNALCLKGLQIQGVREWIRRRLTMTVNKSVLLRTEVLNRTEKFCETARL